MENLQALLQLIEDRCPVQGYTAAALLCTSVRRMKMEKDLGIPLAQRTSSVVWSEVGKPLNEPDQEQWAEIYVWLCERLRARYPGEYARLFASKTPKER